MKFDGDIKLMGMKLLRTELNDIFKRCKDDDIMIDKRKEELLRAVVTNAEQGYRGILAKYENLTEPSVPISR